MSYKVLARKWRPQHFRDMIGQEPVLRALINALDTGRLHHAYLFTGMRGVGKTTIARIFAKCLNCVTNGVSSSPCGECSACRDIEAGRFFDLIEVDAASRTKVDETRELLENVPYAPASGRYKVYLIDEVHMFSTHSFNALLKTLEEPPEHVKFLLATTDPQKVPLTVLSRCLQFNLRRMPVPRLADYLASILDSEEIPHERTALELLAQAAEGSVRDALSLAEQATAFGEGAVREGEVGAMLGRVSTERLAELLDALGEGDLAALFARVETLAEYAPDFGQLLGELLSLLHRVALAQSVPAASVPEAAARERIASLASRLAPDELQLWYQIGLHARRDLPFAPDPREAFDMALLRMHAFAPQRAAETEAAPVMPSADRPDRAPTTPGIAAIDPNTVLSPPAPPPGPNPTAAPEPSSTPVARSGSTPPSESTTGTPTSPTAAPTAVVASSPERSPPAEASGAATLTPEGWSAVVEAAGLSGMPRQLAAHCALVSCEGDRLVLQLEAGAEHMNSPRFAERLRTALVAWAGRELALDVRVVDEPLETPARRDAAREENALAEARRAIDEDPLVQVLVSDVDGALDPTSVRPREPASDTPDDRRTGEQT